MNDDYLTELDEEFKDDPDYQALSREEKIRIVSVLEKMMALGMGAVYGDESDDAADAVVDCSKYIDQCQAQCCSYVLRWPGKRLKRVIFSTTRINPFLLPGIKKMDSALTSIVKTYSARSGQADLYDAGVMIAAEMKMLFQSGLNRNKIKQTACH